MLKMTNPPLLNSCRKHELGMAMLEALIAILVFSFGLLGMAGFQAKSIKAQDEAKKRADAAFVANQIAGDMWGVASGQLASCAGTFSKGPGGCGTSSWGDRIEKSLPGGQAVVAVDGTQVTITLTWYTPGVEEKHSYVHMANIARNE